MELQRQSSKTFTAPFSPSWLVAYLKRQPWIGSLYNTRPQYIDWQPQKPFVKVEVIEGYNTPSIKGLPLICLKFSVVKNKIRCLAYCPELDTQSNSDYPSIYIVSTKSKSNSLDSFIGYYSSNTENRTVTHERHMYDLIDDKSIYFDIRYLALKEVALSGYKACQEIINQMDFDLSQGCSLDKYKGNFK